MTNIFFSLQTYQKGFDDCKWLRTQDLAEIDATKSSEENKSSYKIFTWMRNCIQPRSSRTVKGN